jgi:hypothetical protein
MDIILTLAGITEFDIQFSPVMTESMNMTTKHFKITRKGLFAGRKVGIQISRYNLGRKRAPKVGSLTSVHLSAILRGNKKTL